jgi:hypothetical protein
MIIYYFNYQGEVGIPFLTKFSLGSLQGTFVMCPNQFLGVKGKNHFLECPKGVISELKFFGAIADVKKAKYMKPSHPIYKSEADRKYGFNYCGNPDYINDEDRCNIIDKQKV